jgi:TolB-like protein/Tfp pilus assembly protein PilF
MPGHGIRSPVSDSKKAVFMSYASEDAGAAELICASLRAAGIEVWFDQTELRGGDAWDTAIRNQIRACALFIPIISLNSHARSEGYFRLEWKLAIDRSHLMAPDRPFLVPVVIDDTDEADRSVPDRFREVQWTSLPGGQATPAFIQRVARLLSPELPAPGKAARPMPTVALIAPLPRRSPRRAVIGLGLAAVVIACFVAARFILLEGAKQRAAPAAAIDTGPSAIATKSIAVLPFLDLSEAKDQEYFADGMSEELIDLLSQIKELQVIARTSSFYFKGKQATIAQIAKQLGVASVLEGSVRKAGNTVRVTVQLIRADSGVHQWSQTYDRDMKDIFRVQDEIAAAVVGALKLTLLPAQQLQNAYRSDNPEAYNQYLLGRQHFKGTNGEAIRSTIEAFRKAIVLDPGYAAAYAGLSDAEAALSDFIDDPNTAEQQALADAQKAIDLAPAQALGYISRAAMRQTYSWDWAGAQADLERALSLDSGNSSAHLEYSSLLSTLGRQTEAQAAAKRATELDPLSTAAWSDLCRLLTSSGQFAAALEANQRVLDISPGYAYAVNNLGRLQLFNGQPTQALLTFKRVEIDELRLMGISISEHTLGHKIESQQALDALIAKGAAAWAYQIGEVYAWRGENDKAFEWLERAYAQRDSAIPGLKVSPIIQFSSLPKDPRYSALLRRLKLPV